MRLVAGSKGLSPYYYLFDDAKIELSEVSALTLRGLAVNGDVEGLKLGINGRVEEFKLMPLQFGITSLDMLVKKGHKAVFEITAIYLDVDNMTKNILRYEGIVHVFDLDWLSSSLNRHLASYKQTHFSSKHLALVTENFAADFFDDMSGSLVRVMSKEVKIYIYDNLDRMFYQLYVLKGGSIDFRNYITSNYEEVVRRVVNAEGLTLIQFICNLKNYLLCLS